MNSKIAGINDLPIELYEQIFKDYLSINDLLNCRLVNKKFKCSTYECVNKLVVGELNEIYNDYWLHNNELVNDDHVISLKCFVNIRSKSLFNLNKHLKYLKINTDQDDYKVDCFNFNSFINLESLEISNMNYDSKLNLNLNNLKYFKFHFRSLSKVWEMNTPKLEKIKIFRIMNIYRFHNKEPMIQIKSNPESIKHLIAYAYENELKQFKNLEIIEFTHPYKLSEENRSLLDIFKNLKQVKFHALSENLKHFLKGMSEEEGQLDRDIDIYLHGVKVIEAGQLNDFKSYNGNILEFQLNNYNLLDLILPSITYLNYFELNNHYDNLRNDLPSSFFDKYQNISEVDVSYCPKTNKPIDADHLKWFLNNLKYLKKLEIDSVLLNQYFFNNLPNTIKELRIIDNKSLYLNINFNFILKLIKLIDFYQDGWNIDLFELAFRSFSNLLYLKTFEFAYNDEKIIKIKKINKSMFKLEINYEDCELKLNYGQLIKKCNEFRLK